VAVTMARAVGIVEPGGPEVLRVVERAVRDPIAGEVRLAVKAAAVNPTDVGMRKRGAAGPPPWVPGMDAAGVVESVGPEVESVSVGDEVMAAVLPRRPEGGAQSQLVVVPAASVAPVPAGAGFEEAATLPMNGLTAMRGLELLDLPPGGTLLVAGGAGLLASYVIPLAKQAGLRVLADAAPADEQFVRGLGSDVVLRRGDALAAAVRAAVPGGVDAVFDTALLGRALFPALRDGGALVFVRTWDGEPVEAGITIHPVQVADVLERTDWLQELSELAGRGVLALRVAGTFGPERAADAHRRLEAGGLRGRAIVVFD
jgi:NADPH:quinone reductase